MKTLVAEISLFPPGTSLTSRQLRYGIGWLRVGLPLGLPLARPVMMTKRKKKEEGNRPQKSSSSFSPPFSSPVFFLPIHAHTPPPHTHTHSVVGRWVADFCCQRPACVRRWENGREKGETRRGGGGKLQNSKNLWKAFEGWGRKENSHPLFSFRYNLPSVPLTHPLYLVAFQNPLLLSLFSSPTSCGVGIHILSLLLLPVGCLPTSHRHASFSFSSSSSHLVSSDILCLFPPSVWRSVVSKDLKVVIRVFSLSDLLPFQIDSRKVELSEWKNATPWRMIEITRRSVLAVTAAGAAAVRYAGGRYER